MGGCCVDPVYDRDPAGYGNFNTTSFTATAGAPTITFTVKRASHGNIRIFVRADADAPNDEFEADVEIRNNGPSGSIVHNPTADDGGIHQFWDPDFPSNTNHYGDRPLEPIGLAPGIYWAELQIFTDGTDVDIADQWIRFGP